MAVGVTAPKIDFLWSLSWVALCMACLPITLFSLPWAFISLVTNSPLRTERGNSTHCSPAAGLWLQHSISCLVQGWQAGTGRCFLKWQSAEGSWEERFSPRFPFRSQYDPPLSKLHSSAMALSTLAMSPSYFLCSYSSQSPLWYQSMLKSNHPSLTVGSIASFWGRCNCQNRVNNR